jgi:hypothetical protein
MEQIPDAPWIREAERYGMPPYEDPPKCPICGEHCDTVYMDINGDVFACNNCLHEKDAYDWEEEQRELNRPDWVDEKER